MKGRQAAEEVERVGLRLQLRKQQAEAGDIVLLYGDESEALTHPYLARVWAKAGRTCVCRRRPRPKRSRCWASSIMSHANSSCTTSPTKRSSDFIAHLEQLDRLYGPKPGQPSKPVVLVEDNGPIHSSKLSLAALAARAHWLTVEWLPKYAPELNDIEVVWHDLKHHLAHQTFADTEALDRAIHKAVGDLNTERLALPLAKPRISALGQRSGWPLRVRLQASYGNAHIRKSVSRWWPRRVRPLVVALSLVPFNGAQGGGVLVVSFSAVLQYCAAAAGCCPTGAARVRAAGDWAGAAKIATVWTMLHSDHDLPAVGPTLGRTSV